ncbi:MAG: DinB family protein [Reichenbachiella sp.]|uniref:DinB family protein n=1 Tax=Reichenbachiella sp. TaxID=2184521 RepID=UPI003266742A
MTDLLSKELNQIIESTLRKLETLETESWNHKPAPDKWSKKEVFGHLIDSALNNIHRFVRIQYGDHTNFYYDQDFWVKANDYQAQDLNTILLLWKMLNLQIAVVWKGTSDSDLQKTIPVKDELPTLQFLMEDYLVHMNHHLKKIIG